MGAALRIAASDPDAFLPAQREYKQMKKRVDDLARGGSGWTGHFPRQEGVFQLPVEE
tara:strand:- start:65 stop:235 length:171 start_codon:yes stop_codon:yes gene_type:complete